MTNLNEYLDRLYLDTDQAYAFREGADLKAWRSSLRGRFIEALGGFPGQKADLVPAVLERVEFDHYVREKVEITTYEHLRMPMYVLTPKGNPGPLPAVIVCHGHGYGAKEILGLAPDGTPLEKDFGIYKRFAMEFVERGYLVIAPELLGFGERRLEEDKEKPPKESSCTRLATSLLMMGKTLGGYRVYETIRAIDYLMTRDDADPGRIGCTGISGGGLVSAFTSALDERIGAAVVSGYTNTFEDSIMSIRHCIDNYIPGILELAEMPDLIGLIAPRPLLIEAGRNDRIFPVKGVEKAYAKLVRIYEAVNAKANLDLDLFEGGHEIGGAKQFDWFSRLNG